MFSHSHSHSHKKAAHHDDGKGDGLNTKAPTRRMDGYDKALVSTAEWNVVDRINGDHPNVFQLEDKVSLAHNKAVFLQGLVVYVGPVHFAKGTHVGVQLTGPSLGRGNMNGVYDGKQYFANVGRNNGILAPAHQVSKRLPKLTGDPKIDAQQARRFTEEARLADLKFIDALVQHRALAMLKLAEERQALHGVAKRLGKGFASLLAKEETHITRLKQMRLADLMKSRGEDPGSLRVSGDYSYGINAPTLKYAPRESPLQPCDLELAEGLEQTHQNFCLSDPTLPDNPITFASQAFLNMTGYTLNEILGRNCRFLQGKKTDPAHVYRLRLCIQEGSDCHVCLLNFKKDGTPFYNRLFMTALRDKKGRIKNYLGVQCEVSEELARQINNEEQAKMENSVRSQQNQVTDAMQSRTNHSGTASSNGSTCTDGSPASMRDSSATMRDSSTRSESGLSGKNNSRPSDQRQRRVSKKTSQRRQSDTTLEHDSAARAQASSSGREKKPPRRQRSAPNLREMDNASQTSHAHSTPDAIRRAYEDITEIQDDDYEPWLVQALVEEPEEVEEPVVCKRGSDPPGATPVAPSSPKVEHPKRSEQKHDDYEPSSPLSSSDDDDEGHRAPVVQVAFSAGRITKGRGKNRRSSADLTERTDTMSEEFSFRGRGSGSEEEEDEKRKQKKTPMDARSVDTTTTPWESIMDNCGW